MLLCGQWLRFTSLVLLSFLLFPNLNSQTGSIELVRSEYYSALNQNNLEAASKTAFSLVEKFREVKIDSSILWVKKALEHAQTIKDQPKTIEFLINYSELTFLNRKHNYSLKYSTGLRHSMAIALQADSLLKHFPNDTLNMFCLYRRAEGNEFYNEQELAMRLYLECFNMAKKTNHVDMLTKISLKLGDISLVNDDYTEAVEHYKSGLKYTETSDLNKWKLLGNICQTRINYSEEFPKDDVFDACTIIKSFFDPSNPVLNHPVNEYFKDLKTICTIEYGTQKEINNLLLSSVKTIKEKAADNDDLLKQLSLNFKIALRQKKALECAQYIKEMYNYERRVNTLGVYKVVLSHDAEYLEFTKDYEKLVVVIKKLNEVQLKFRDDERMSVFANLEGKLEAKEKEYEIEILAAQSRQFLIIALLG